MSTFPPPCASAQRVSAWPPIVALQAPEQTDAEYMAMRTSLGEIQRLCHENKLVGKEIMLSDPTKVRNYDNVTEAEYTKTLEDLPALLNVPMDQLNDDISCVLKQTTAKEDCWSFQNIAKQEH